MRLHEFVDIDSFKVPNSVMVRGSDQFEVTHNFELWKNATEGDMLRSDAAGVGYVAVNPYYDGKLPELAIIADNILAVLYWDKTGKSSNYLEIGRIL